MLSDMALDPPSLSGPLQPQLCVWTHPVSSGSESAGEGHAKRAGLHPVPLASLSLFQGRGLGTSEPCFPGFAGSHGAAMGAL